MRSATIFATRHVWLSYGPVLSRVFISPAQHQIHHSKAPQHFDKNFGFIFAFWDVWFGSLYVPRAKEHIDVGLPDRQDEAYSSVLRLYALPFARSATTGVRRASVAMLAVILVVLCTQSVLILRTAFAQAPGRNAGGAESPQCVIFVDHRADDDEEGGEAQKIETQWDLLKDS